MTPTETREVVCHCLTEDLMERARRRPDRKLTCKFVLIDLGEAIALVLGAVAEYKYHANLVDHFCASVGIPCGWEQKPDVVAVLDGQTRLRGGGWLVLEAATGTLRAGGQSKAYGPHDPDLLRRALSGCPLFSAFALQIES